LRELIGETRRAQSERRALEQELSDVRAQSLLREIASTPSASPRPAFDSSIDDDDEPRKAPRDRIVKRFLRRYEEAGREASRDLDELLEAIDVKVADLADLDERALPEAAIEVAALLLRAAKSARRSLE
jgi:uncharacterized protein YPO0396